MIVFRLFVFLLAYTLNFTGHSKPLNLCHHYADAAEKIHKLPAGLLRAMANHESGKYNNQQKRKIAWPWALNINGKPIWHENQTKAILDAKQQQGMGKKSIDVGCMQINLQHHPKAFKNLNEALDPRINTFYAALFLKNLFKKTGSWEKAIKHYHSKNERQNTSYYEKVKTAWALDNPRYQDLHTKPVILNVSAKQIALDDHLLSSEEGLATNNINKELPPSAAPSLTPRPIRSHGLIQLNEKGIATARMIPVEKSSITVETRRFYPTQSTGAMFIKGRKFLKVS